MLKLLVVAFPLLMLASIGIAIYVQYATSTLSFPIPTATTVLTILLPLFAVANIIYTPLLNRLLKRPTLQLLLVPALHILQGGITVIIATLAAQGFVPDSTLDCKLEKDWQLLWHNHDFRAIERIQNAFDCCGFNSVVDRTWPKQCAEIYNRDMFCNVPWRASMQRTSGLQFAVAVLAGIIQLAHLVYLRQRGQRRNAAQDFKNIPRQVEDGDSERLIEDNYHDSDDEGASVDQSASGTNSPDTRDNAPHRVEPSGLGHDEANEWRS
ncbi:hypothetical protein F4825DRAFT_418504 [Nemania diffusa]|nr:hypothetical protein F4825DRAFT_418504 [Nemania diffusa]